MDYFMLLYSFIMCYFNCFLKIITYNLYYWIMLNSCVFTQQVYQTDSD